MLLLPLLLAGCGGLLSNAPERQLYRINPSFAFPVGVRPLTAQLLIAAPTAPAGLDTKRIALSHSPVTLDYYAGVEWTDRAPFLVQDALVEGFQKSGTVPKVAADRGGLRADYVLDTAIDDFAASYDSPQGAPLVRVALNAKLVRMPERVIVAHQAIHHEQRAAANAMPEIVHAFDGALGGAVQDVVAWTVGNPALSARPGPAR
ncbi:MAG: ABC-type transport auxiliary lipoprotein family protein [Thiohalocapsa sp.]